MKPWGSRRLLIACLLSLLGDCAAHFAHQQRRASLDQPAAPLAEEDRISKRPAPICWIQPPWQQRSASPGQESDAAQVGAKAKALRIKDGISRSVTSAWRSARSLELPRFDSIPFPRVDFDEWPAATSNGARALWQLAVSTAVIPYAALSASFAGCSELVHSLPIHTAHGLSGEQLRRAWFGVVAGAACGTIALVAAALSAWLGAIEFAARAGKSAFGAIAAQLAEGAHFGSAAARGEPPLARGWDLSRGWRLASAEGGLFSQPTSEASAGAESADRNAQQLRGNARRGLLRRRGRRWRHGEDEGEGEDSAAADDDLEGPEEGEDEPEARRQEAPAQHDEHTEHEYYEDDEYYEDQDGDDDDAFEDE